MPKKYKNLRTESDRQEAVLRVFLIVSFLLGILTGRFTKS
jgi:hypothetical protein